METSKIYLVYTSITYATKAYNALSKQTFATLTHSPNLANTCSYSVVISKENIDIAPREKLVGAFEQTDDGFSEVAL